MKNRLLSLTLSLSLLFVGMSSLFSQERKARKDMENYRYEIECVGTGTQGTYLIKVWTYSKKSSVAIAQSKKNAVHGVIFKGFAGSGQGCTSQKALAGPDVEEKKNEFFEKFFSDSGDFNKYVSVSNDGAIDAGDRVKVGKEYKIGVVVSVMKDQLRADLEQQGIIRGLDSGF
jgi:hypothetical protein